MPSRSRVQDLLIADETVVFSYSCLGSRRSADAFDRFQGRVYFTPYRLIWISAVRESGLMGWLERQLFLRNELRGTFDVPIAAIQAIEIEEHLFRWVETIFRVTTTDAVVGFLMGSGPVGCRFLQNRAAARAARFVQEVKPDVVVRRV